jgi:putative membrane protein
LSQRDFFSAEARQRAAQAIKRIEAETSAEIVITVKRVSGSYRDADVVVGAVVAWLVLLLLLFLPQDFDVRFMPLDVIFGFVVGYVVTMRSDTLRRLATRAKSRQARVEAAARAAFVDQGISRTRDRTGVLVYVSMLERRVIVVGDRAFSDNGLASVLDELRITLDKTLARSDFAAFIEGLEALGPRLAPALPRAEDDENELPDEVHA